MSNLSMCFISVLVVTLNASLTVAIAQENSSIEKISDMTLNNTLLNNITPGNTGLNTSAANNISVNLTSPKSIESMNNNDANTSINLSTAQSMQSDEAVFIIGDGATSNESAYNVDIPTVPAKNASNLWYVIQAKPHGMV